MTKNMIDPLISVIVPVYNVEKYLPECIESIISQSYENLEILLVDYGSTDRSGAICDAFAKKNERIRVIHQENGGISAARNKGLDNCSGEYITFVDSDDYISCDMIKVLYTNLVQTESSAVVCGFTETDDTKKIISKHMVSETIALSGAESLLYLYNNKHKLNLYTVSSKLFKRSVFHDIRFDEAVFFEDTMIMPYWCLKCDKILYIPYLGYFYRRIETSITMKKSPEHIKKLYLDSFRIFNEHISFYQNNGMYELKNCIENELADKIITHSLRNKIPDGLEKYTKKEFNRHFMSIIHSDISLGRKMKMCCFRIFGIRIARFVYKIRKTI